MDFLVREFFLDFFNFWDMVYFVLNIRSKFLDFCDPYSEMLTSGTR